MERAEIRARAHLLVLPGVSRYGARQPSLRVSREEGVGWGTQHQESRPPAPSRTEAGMVLAHQDSPWLPGVRDAMSRS